LPLKAYQEKLKDFSLPYSTEVTVKQGGTTYVYGEHGEIKFTK